MLIIYAFLCLLEEAKKTGLLKACFLVFVELYGQFTDKSVAGVA
jgi:hypothetical protein